MSDYSAQSGARRRDKISLGHSHLELPGVIRSQVSESAKAVSLMSAERKDVTQAAGAITNSVTADGLCGTITTIVATVTAAGAAVAIPWVNKHLTASSIVLLTTEYAGTAGGAPVANVRALTTGGCSIVLANAGATTLDAVVKIHYLVISNADQTLAFP